ncbi:MAG: DUF456 family protein [Bacillota bacterium]
MAPFLGAVIADYTFRRCSKQAFRSGVGASLGCWSAFPIKLILKVTMIGWFVMRIL